MVCGPRANGKRIPADLANTGQVHRASEPDREVLLVVRQHVGRSDHDLVGQRSQSDETCAAHDHAVIALTDDAQAAIRVLPGPQRLVHVRIVQPVGEREVVLPGELEITRRIVAEAGMKSIEFGARIVETDDHRAAEVRQPSEHAEALLGPHFGISASADQFASGEVGGR